jgi:DNA-binding FadR family transcriptional regulator
VSRPSLREALRILESEGLITVRRGNLGGAVVHAPRVGNAAYSVGLVLQSKRVPMTDLRDAIKSIEPVGAGLCAAREDRYETARSSRCGRRGRRRGPATRASSVSSPTGADG